MTLGGEAESLQAALDERYLLECELGIGGMATVYLAHDRKHDRRVAIKVLRADIAGSAGSARFLTEILLAANLQHPHIVGLIDSGDLGNTEKIRESRPYYVMPFVDGETLRDRLSRDGPLPIADVIRITGEVADALACAHGAGVVHRDIKPENILLTQRHAMVADFGVAKALMTSGYVSTSTTVGVTVGTVSYMAPEQIVADPDLDHRVDLYALGVVGYEMLTGQAPFAGSPTQIVSGHLTRAPGPIAELRPDCPPALQEFVLQLLAKSPADRPQSALDVCSALSAISTAGAVERPGIVRPRSRSSWRTASAVLLAAIVIAGIVRLVAKRGTGTAAKAGARVARSLAILPFQNIGAILRAPISATGSPKSS